MHTNARLWLCADLSTKKTTDGERISCLCVCVWNCVSESACQVKENADKWPTNIMFIRQMPCMPVKITYVLSLLDNSEGGREEKERRAVIGRELF